MISPYYKLVDSGPYLNMWGEARAWALGRLASPLGSPSRA